MGYSSNLAWASGRSAVGTTPAPVSYAESHDEES